jgi:GTP cyclohydrolase III
MFGAKTINRHAALMNRMAETLGVDLTQAIADGRMPAEAWREAVVRCTGCSDPEGCQHWLADHAADETPPEAPGYCRNRALMQSLRPALARE